MRVSFSDRAKKALFSLYLAYLFHFPFAIGKGFLTRLIRHLGTARYQIDGTLLDLNPCAWIDRTLIARQTHDPFVRNIMEKRLKDGGIFVDIGANIGVFSLAAARLPGVLVYAFEPSPRELKRLYVNLAANQATNIVVYPIALGKTPAWLNLTLGGDLNPGTNSFVPQSGDGAPLKTALCRCEPFETLFTTATLKQIKVVKMDVEGFEMEVLGGMSGAIRQMDGVVFVVEVTRSFLKRAGSSAEDLYRFFRDHGFTAMKGMQDGDQWDEAFTK